jgi:ABC-type multidrug transport system ATPase subunit
MLLVQIRGLVKHFGAIKAVDGLDMSVEEGQIFGLLGLNGAGKSTTIRCLLSLIRPDAGSIEVGGYTLERNRAEVLQQIGSMVEKPDHYKNLSGLTNLRLSARMYGIDPTRALTDKTLEIVGLKGRENQLFKTYSQGMKQRLGIALALLHDPKLMILDEPTNGLDPQGILDLRNLILRLKHEFGKTVILSSHILSEVELIADSMVIVHGGKNVVQGSVQKLLSEDDLLVNLETNNPAALKTALAATRFSSRISETEDHQLTVKASRNEIPDLQRICAQTGIDIYGISAKKRLEDYFLKLTHHG